MSDIISQIMRIGRVKVKISKGKRRTIAAVALILPVGVIETDEIIRAGLDIGCTQVRSGPVCAWRERGVLAGLDPTRPFAWVETIENDRDGIELAREAWGQQ